MFKTSYKRHLWANVTTSMMSDEEAVEDGSMKRRQPEWRSQVFNKLMDRLDERATNSKFARRKG